MGKTLFEKIWDKHLIASIDASTNLIFIDLHLVHEVTSPQAFDSLRLSNRKVRHPELTLATVDHGVPTSNRLLGIKDPLSKIQIEALENNCNEFGVTLFGINDPRQGIVHVIGPEQGITQPGMTIVCGDSHTATHGAFGALAFGIGTSEVEHVLATQTLAMEKPKTMKVEVVGDVSDGVGPKDIILGIIRKIGTGGGAGHVIEYVGDVIKNMSMENRMTICNMSIEGGARAGMIAPDEVTFNYLKDKNYSPKDSDWSDAINEWSDLYSDEDASFDKIVATMKKKGQFPPKKDEEEDKEKKEEKAVMKKKAELEEEVDAAEASEETLENAEEPAEVAVAEAMGEEDPAENLRSVASEWLGSILQSNNK